ncbi:MAG TPA: hypothetical protein VFF27_04630 [Bacteroidia bacterium]|nr:hypothetical protein [Bacteroidia bacterium]
MAAEALANEAFLVTGFVTFFLADAFTLTDLTGLAAFFTDLFFEGLLTALETTFLEGLLGFEVLAGFEDLPFAFLAAIGFFAFFEADFDFVGFTFFTLYSCMMAVYASTL